MKVSRAQVTENRQKILKAASRLFREKGFEAVRVDDVMQAAGLTHGGFYGYFKSKQELIAAAIAGTSSPRTSGKNLADLAAAYLSPAHRANRGGGCLFAALAGEAVRLTPEIRAAMTQVLCSSLDRLSETAPGETPAQRRQAAIGSFAAMLGGLTLARLSDDAALSDEILAAARAWTGIPPARGTAAPY
jgi:TetR/AcrR family transcriptional regulator, transcriptional repressor for nem operon